MTPLCRMGVERHQIEVIVNRNYNHRLTHFIYVFHHSNSIQAEATELGRHWIQSTCCCPFGSKKIKRQRENGGHQVCWRERMRLFFLRSVFSCSVIFVHRLIQVCYLVLFPRWRAMQVENRILPTAVCLELSLRGFLLEFFNANWAQKLEWWWWWWWWWWWKQETQLSLTNRATRLQVSQGHQTWYHSIC